MSFRIRNLETGAIEPGLPSPRLIEAGGGMAYWRWLDDKSTSPYWYLREAGYESPEGQYTRVRIEHTEDWRVDVTITPIDPDGKAEDPYEDVFIVEAATEQEAFDLAGEEAHDDVENRYGDDYASDVTTIRARRGVSI